MPQAWLCVEAEVLAALPQGCACWCLQLPAAISPSSINSGPCLSDTLRILPPPPPPLAKKIALITGSVCPLFSDKPIRSRAEAQASGFGSC